jgi:cytidyltransferase-like protein
MQRHFKTVCVSGYFDPLHSGHIDYFKNAKLLGDKLIVILNLDCQRQKQSAVPIDERKTILEALRDVDEVVFSVDTNCNVCDTLKEIKPYIFAKGENASEEEKNTCDEMCIELVTNVGVKVNLQDILSSFYPK